MTARMRRLASDYEQVKKDFAGHRYIQITPVGTEPPEKYHVTYFVNGIFRQPDGQIQTLGRHEVEITLHAEYPRYKPICHILTPIFHPNFRDGQICIGDIWGAGESLSDIIINIGDMIQYKSWNASSPLSAEAAKWAIENKHVFPVGNINLLMADYASAKDTVEIDMFDEDSGETDVLTPPAEEGDVLASAPVEESFAQVSSGNDFDITAEELAGIQFVPTAQRMQTMAPGQTVKGGGLNLKTVLIKGLLWAFIGALLGFFLSEFTEKNITSNISAAQLCGHGEFAEYYEYRQAMEEADRILTSEFNDWCKQNGMDPDDSDSMSEWIYDGISERAEDALDDYSKYSDKADTALYEIWEENYDFDGDNNADDDEIEKLFEAQDMIVRVQTGLWAAVIALVIGLLLGVGEGVYYGSAANAVKYGLIGAGISLVLGFVSGFAAQWMYAEMLQDDATEISAALIRGLGWSLMGLGVGLSVGLIRPGGKRILFCALGGLIGGFIGGFLFNYVFEWIPDDVVARGVAIVIMGILIGLGVGLLEQMAKQAWLKVVRGEFEGKEYLVFDGTTSIGNTGKNTIVLFKDRLVGPHHCDIVLEGNKYVLVDCGTPMGTVVNGNRIQRHMLRHGDAIAIGNSVLVFNTK